MLNPSTFIVANVLIFQLAWFCAALIPEYAFSILAALLLLHFLLSPQRIADAKLLPLALVGFTLDNLLIGFGWLVVNTESRWWLLLLWCHFVLSCNHSLAFVLNMPRLMVGLLGAAGGVLSYYGALQFGVMSSPLALSEFVLIWAVWWAVLFTGISYWLNRQGIS